MSAITEILVSADRFFSAGFQLEIGAGLVMALKPSDGKLHIISSVGESDRRQASLVRWNPEKLRLIIDKWEDTPPRLTLKIAPLNQP